MSQGAVHSVPWLVCPLPSSPEHDPPGEHRHLAVGADRAWTLSLPGLMIALLPFPQERRLDSLDVVVSLQHYLWDRLPGAAALLQQPHSQARGPGVRGTEPRGKVRDHPAASTATLTLTLIPARSGSPWF